MKFISLGTTNFRMLRDLTFDFSVDPDKPITIIRAENETGKTTLWRAIAWLLHGEKFLKKLKDYQLTPKSWITDGEGKLCEIQVSLEFLHEVKSNLSSDNQKRYRLVRTVKERYHKNEKNFKPIDASKAQLFECTDAGLTPITPDAKANNLIKTFFPLELIDIFLLNGDAMESQMFSEQDNQTQSRTTVEDFLRKALDIKAYENAQKHSKRVKSIKLDSLGESIPGDEENLATKVNEINGRLDELTGKMTETRESISNLDDEILELRKRIDDAQTEGNRVDLLQDKKDLEDLLVDAKQKEFQNLEKLGVNLHSDYFAIDCLSESMLNPFKEKVDTLKQEGVIPNKTVPFLERVLSEHDICICGATLSEENTDGKKRREHIQHLINSSKDQDETSKIVTELEYQCISMNIWKKDRQSNWLENQESFEANVLQAREEQEDIGSQIADKDTQLDDLSNTDVNQLRELLQDAKDDRNTHKQQQERQILTEINENNNLQAAEVALAKYIKEQSENTSLNAQIDLISDVENVFSEILILLKNQKAKDVSNKMNSTFLKMTGEQDEALGPIREVVITEDKDVRVTTTEGIQFTPRDNLNGASLRALTLSFVLALCKESGKSLPHIIDTPFGMTSGTRKSILLEAIKNSEQLVLCLTPSEIRGLERVFMSYTDPEYSYTLTFSDHHPRWLKKRTSDISETTRCECTFVEWCDECERKEWDDKTIFDKELYDELQQEYSQ